MILGKFFKAPADRKRYSIDYEDWLDTAETVSTATFVVTPADATPVVIDDIAIDTDGKGIVFYASEGIAGTTYKAVVTMTSSGAQVREDTVQYTVRAS